MLTTCPECRTTFRLGHDQLEARRGLVRCGHCRAVFNAYDTLQAEPAPAPPDASPASPMPERPPMPAPSPLEPSPVIEALAPPGPDDIPAGLAGEAGGTRVPERIDPVIAPEVALPRFEPAPTLPFETPAPTAEDTDRILLSELPTRSQAEPDHPILRALVQTILVLLLLAVLLAQGAFFLRAPLAAWQPGLRPTLEAACQPLGCEVPWLADADAIRVEASSLETDAEQPSRATLKVSFSNRSHRAQPWPTFVLKLTDWKSATLAQKRFGATDYLSAEGATATGMPARSEHEFKLDLNLGGLGASGYEVRVALP
ncbi:MAG: DUF3426 domain-containing protein [Pseudomonadota bacterium]